MAKQFFLFKWIEGMQLGRFFQHIFDQKTASGEISVADAAAKTVNVVEQVRPYWNLVKPDIELVFSDDVTASIERVEGIVDDFEAKVKEIQTLPDIPKTLQEYRFADDDKRNDFYHELLSIAAAAFSDGKISEFEAVSFFTRIAVFVKETK